MARLVKQTKASNPEDAVWYRPDIGDNRHDPEPFECLILPMSGAEWRKAEEDLGALTGRVNPLRRANTMLAAVITKRVIHVRGYEVTDQAGNVQAPRNGAELVDALDRVDATELELVVNDLVGAIKDRSRLEAGAPNASRSLSVS